MENFYEHLANAKTVAVAGDWHMNTERVNKVLTYVESKGVDVILHVGDFGYYPSLPGYEEYVSMITNRAKLHDYFVLFIDGNHEQYASSGTPAYSSDAVLTRAGLNDLRDTANEDGFVFITPRVVWATRGATARLGTAGGKRGMSFLACGGAGSINIEFEQMRRYWSINEQVTTEDVQRVKGGVERLGGVVDMMLTHDAPPTAPVPQSRIQSSLSNVPTRVLARAERSRANIADAVVAAKPRVLVHGHWHVRNDSKDVAVSATGGSETFIVPRVLSLPDEFSQAKNVEFFSTEQFS